MYISFKKYHFCREKKLGLDLNFELSERLSQMHYTIVLPRSPSTENCAVFAHSLSFCKNRWLSLRFRRCTYCAKIMICTLFSHKNNVKTKYKHTPTSYLLILIIFKLFAFSTKTFAKYLQSQSRNLSNQTQIIIGSCIDHAQ